MILPNDYFEGLLPLVEKDLELALSRAGGGPEIRSVMAYGVFPGGKRIRPLLCLGVADLLEASPYQTLPLATAIELIHTFTLVHDDLPCLDDDDFRRGRASCHKHFGEDKALLGGDALIFLALSHFLSRTKEQGIPAERILETLEELSWATGGSGVIGGQMEELMLPTPFTSEELLEVMEKKTARLFSLAAKGSAVLCGAEEKTVKALENFANALGIAFQLNDDLLDAEKKGEIKNMVKALGLEKTRQLAFDYTEEALRELAVFGDKAVHLRALALYLTGREK